MKLPALKKATLALTSLAVLSASATALAYVPINGRVSLGPIGLLSGLLGNQSNGNTFGSSISGDGRFIAFSSDASNLTLQSDTNTVNDVFLYDRLTTLMTPISLGANGNFVNGPTGPGLHGARLSGTRSVSSDGRFVLFYSDARVTSDDADNTVDVFVRDTFLLGSTRLVSRASGANGAQSADFDFPVGLSADGRYAFFLSSTQFDANDVNDDEDVFRRDLNTNITVRVTPSPDGGVLSAEISRDGRYVAFSTDDQLSATDLNDLEDVYLVDINTNTTQLVSADTSGKASGGAHPVVSGGAERVAYAPTSTFPFTGTSRIWTRATNTRSDVVLSSPDASPLSNIIVRNLSRDGRYAGVQADHKPAGGQFAVTQAFYLDVQTGSSAILSKSASGAEPNNATSPDSISDDGSIFSTTSSATNLVPNDTNGKSDAFFLLR